MCRSVGHCARLGKVIKSATQHELLCRSATRLSQQYRTSSRLLRDVPSSNCASLRTLFSDRAAMSARDGAAAVDQTSPLKPGDEFIADSGVEYKIESVLKESLEPLLYVCRAKAKGKDYVVKNVPGSFDYQVALQKILPPSPNVRALVDTARPSELLIFPYLASDLLQFAPHPVLSTHQSKNVLNQALSGLADLHQYNVLHNDIKPNNILIDYQVDEAIEGQPQLNIRAVQISDLDDAVIVPPGKYLHGPLCGNQFWRSPESWARGSQNQASDIFSFGIVAIYVMLNDMVFFTGKDEGSVQDPWRPILSRHISYFGDLNGMQGLLDYLGEENLFSERLKELACEFSKTNPLKPFRERHGIDLKFRDLISKMTNLDPAARITAQEALGHEWFRSERGFKAPRVELEAARAAYERERRS